MKNKVKNTVKETNEQFKQLWNNFWEFSVAVSIMIVSGWVLYTVKPRINGVDALMIVGVCACVALVAGVGAFVRFLMNKR